MGSSSPSTEGYDRGGKFAIYRALPGQRQYLLIAQDRYSVDLFTRQPNGRWVLDAYGAPDDLIPPDCTVTLGEIYDKFLFEPADDSPNPQ